ncbi:hypothetical protein [Nocardiopsis sp. NPDC058789]|uniref:hypothetical protein n=1 Tax=Nocardiopsis sp. NPDC058789 TaxID=3346634 RepID=UPI00366BF7A2
MRSRRPQSRLSSGFRSGRWVRLSVWALLLAFPLALLLGGMNPAHSEDDDDLDSLSFYRLSSSMTALFSTAQEPGNDEFNIAENHWPSVLHQPGSAGSMLGYPDEQYNVIRGWIDSRNAQSSNEVGYDSLVGTKDSGFPDHTGARDFAYFGATLNGLGLDSTSTGLTLGFFSWLSGGFVLILFVAAAGVDSLWSFIIDALIWINPFRMIYDAVSSLSGSTFADGMTAGEGATTGFGDSGELPEPLASIVELGNFAFEKLALLSWTVMLPLFLGVFVFSLLMFKNLDRGSAIKKILVRFVFIVIGVPLLGSMYSQVLNTMKEATEGGNSAAAQVVLSTYVDFEGWATQNQLAVPDGAFIRWSQTHNAPTGKSQSEVRDTALAINRQVLGISAGALGSPTGNDAMAVGANEGLTQSNYGDVARMLDRYMSTQHVNASSFESDAKSTLEGEQIDKAPEWFDDFIGDPEDVKDEAANENPLLFVRSDTGLTASEEGEGGPVRFTSAEGTKINCRGTITEDNEGSPSACNLAPLAMYNYLNADFGSTSYKAYSSGKSSSEATRSIHNSVNLVGTGMMSSVYWFNAVVLLGAFVVIGIGYAIGMVVNNIRRTFQMIMAIPFAMLGVVQGIAKVIVYTVAMLMEILVTIFLYKMVLAFLLAVPDFINAPFNAAIAGDEGTGDRSAVVEFLVRSGLLHMLVTLVSIIVVIVFTVMAMRLRKTLVKAVEDSVTKMIEKFTDAKVQSGGGLKSGLPGGGGSSLMSGAAGSKAMSAAKGGKSPRGANAGGTNSGGGPAGAAAATSASSNETKVSGDVDTDGQLEGPGGGGAGAGLDPSAQERDAAGEADLGKRVEREGLSDDPGEAFVGSVQQSASDYAESDKERLKAATGTAGAVGHAGVAVGRAAAQDYTGAAESAGKAVEKGGQAQASAGRAGQASERARKSSLDNPQTSARHDRRIQQGQQAEQAGRTVSNVAGMAGSTGGGGKAPQPQKTPKKPPNSGGANSADQAAKQARNQRRGPKR